MADGSAEKFSTPRAAGTGICCPELDELARGTLAA